jgi:hypothetical protein
MQPPAGGDPAQLTHFDSEPGLISAYAWSRDFKKLAVTRARYNDTDVVMFGGFRSRLRFPPPLARIGIGLREQSRTPRRSRPAGRRCWQRGQTLPY